MTFWVFYSTSSLRTWTCYLNSHVALNLLLLHFGSSLCLAGRNLFRQVIKLETLSNLDTLKLCLVERNRRALAWVVQAVVVRIPHPMKVLVLVFSKMMLNTVHIASDAPPITNVYVATVDGTNLLKNRSCVRTEWCTPLTLKYLVRTEW